MKSGVELPSKDGPHKVESEQYSEDKRLESVVQEHSEPETPTTSFLPSDTDSTQPTTPSSTAKSQTQKRSSKPAIPLAPPIPVVPNAPGTPRQAKDSSSTASETPKPTAAGVAEADSEGIPATESETNQASPLCTAPKSWADLVRAKASARPAAAAGAAADSSVAMQKSESLANVLSSLGEEVTQYSDKIAFLEPRGLVNTGNMCYMNSVSLGEFLTKMTH
jgi:ubiquitin carboxyl-terminal hydrolase 10